MDRLDAAGTALLVVHMAKGVAGPVDTPFSRLFRQRVEKAGVIGVQARLLGRFSQNQGEGGLYAGHVPTRVARGQANSPLFRTLIDSPTLLQGTPAVDVIDDVAPQPNEPIIRGQAANGFDGTALDTTLRVAGVDTVVLVGVATDVAVESTARAASDLQYRTIIVSDACQADTDEAHTRALEVLRKWFGETPTADEVLSALGIPAAGSAHRAACV
jgi:biuret amidohydrolase